MGRLGVFLMIAVFVGAACTSRSKPTIVDTPPASPAPRVVAPAAPAPQPFTDRELADELRRQGIGGASKGDANPTSRPGAILPEITETSRGVIITLPHTHFEFDSYDLEPQARARASRRSLQSRRRKPACRSAATFVSCLPSCPGKCDR